MQNRLKTSAVVLMVVLVGVIAVENAIDQSKQQHRVTASLAASPRQLDSWIRWILFRQRSSDKLRTNGLPMYLRAPNRKIPMAPAVQEMKKLAGGGEELAGDESDFDDVDPLVEEQQSKRQVDDYGHMRYGKRDFDDYGHLRFGR